MDHVYTHIHTCMMLSLLHFSMLYVAACRTDREQKRESLPQWVRSRPCLHFSSFFCSFVTNKKMYEDICLYVRRLAPWYQFRCQTQKSEDQSHVGVLYFIIKQRRAKSNNIFSKEQVAPFVFQRSAVFICVLNTTQTRYSDRKPCVWSFPFWWRYSCKTRSISTDSPHHQGALAFIYTWF